jgi:hypothetical protein
MSDREVPLSAVAKVKLILRIAASWAWVGVGLRHRPMPDLVAALRNSRTTAPALQPRRLSRVVDRVMRIGSFQPRCIIRALVLYRLLREQGSLPEVVIGLPHDPMDHLAHAWVEIDGVDVGPRPGRGNHQELARYA